MANTGVTIFSLLSIVHLYYVLGRQNKEFIFTKERSFERQNVIVNLGSNVTFSCLNRWDVRTNWYKSSVREGAAAYVVKSDTGCILHNEHYPSISLGPCNDDYSGITFISIQYKDRGEWWCTIDVNEILRISQYVYLEVEENVERTTPFQVSTSQTTELVPTKPTTTPRVVTERPGITATSHIPILSTTHGPGISNTRGTSGGESSTVTSKTATSSSKQTVITGRPGVIEDSTTDEGDISTSRSYLIPVVAGVSGVTVLILVVVTIMIIKLRRRKYSQDGGGRQHNDSFNGGPTRVEAECGGIGLEYAQLSATSGHDNDNKPQRSDEEDDELVMADNPIYMSCDQEEKTGNISHSCFCL